MAGERKLVFIKEPLEELMDVLRMGLVGGGGKQAEACNGYLLPVYLLKEGGILYASTVTCWVKTM